MLSLIAAWIGKTYKINHKLDMWIASLFFWLVNVTETMCSSGNTLLTFGIFEKTASQIAGNILVMKTVCYNGHLNFQY